MEFTIGSRRPSDKMEAWKLEREQSDQEGSAERLGKKGKGKEKEKEWWAPSPQRQPAFASSKFNNKLVTTSSDDIRVRGFSFLSLFREGGPSNSWWSDGKFFEELGKVSQFRGVEISLSRPQERVTRSLCMFEFEVQPMSTQ